MQFFNGLSPCARQVAVQQDYVREIPLCWGGCRRLWNIFYIWGRLVRVMPFGGYLGGAGVLFIMCRSERGGRAVAVRHKTPQHPPAYI